MELEDFNIQIKKYSIILFGALNTTTSNRYLLQQILRQFRGKKKREEIADCQEQAKFTSQKNVRPKNLNQGDYNRISERKHFFSSLYRSKLQTTWIYKLPNYDTPMNGETKTKIHSKILKEKILWQVRQHRNSLSIFFFVIGAANLTW